MAVDYLFGNVSWLARVPQADEVKEVKEAEEASIIIDIFVVCGYTYQQCESVRVGRYDGMTIAWGPVVKQA